MQSCAAQPEFDFGPGRKESAARELPFFPSPKDDNERLLNYQHAFRAGDVGALSGMYALLREVALKFITDAGKGCARVSRLSRGEREEKAHDAAAYIISRYLSDRDFAMRESAMIDLNGLCTECWDAARRRAGLDLSTLGILKHCAGECLEAAEAYVRAAAHGVPAYSEELSGKLSDIVTCVLSACGKHGIDIEAALLGTLEKNRARAQE